MATVLTLKLPDDLYDQLRENAMREFRTADKHALWLITTGLEAAKGREARIWPRERYRTSAEILTGLQLIWTGRGKPSTRALASESGLSHTTVAEILKGKSAPSWRVLEKLVTALDGDTGMFRQLWADANGADRDNND